MTDFESFCAGVVAGLDVFVFTFAWFYDLEWSSQPRHKARKRPPVL